MTFAEIEVYCKGYETRMAKLKEVPRLIAGIVLNTNRKKGSSVVSLESLFPLYTDQKRERKELMTKEEFLKAQNLKVKWQDQN